MLLYERLEIAENGAYFRIDCAVFSDQVDSVQRVAYLAQIIAVRWRSIEWFLFASTSAPVLQFKVSIDEIV